MPSRKLVFMGKRGERLFFKKFFEQYNKKKISKLYSKIT